MKQKDIIAQILNSEDRFQSSLKLKKELVKRSIDQKKLSRIHHGEKQKEKRQNKRLG